MINAVLAANPQLYFLTHYTSYGYTIAGFGWDSDYDRDIALSKNGKLYAPNHATNTVTTDNYDYDAWTAVDTDDLWQSGWYSNGYWSYWCKDGFSGEFEYSQLGASSRPLSDGCVDGWLFTSLGGTHQPWKPLSAVPAVGSGTVFAGNYGILYRVLDEENSICEVYGGADNLDPYVYIGERAYCSDNQKWYNVTGIADGAFKDSAVTHLSASTISYIGREAFSGSSKLVEVSNPGMGLRYIGDAAFKGCTSLPAFPISNAWSPTDLTGVSIFEGCTSLTTLPLPTGWTYIPPRYAAGSGVKEFILPTTVAEIGDEAFAECVSLSDFTVSSLTPLEIPANTFAGIKETAVLHVPYQAVEAYASAAGWSSFKHIEEALPPTQYPVGMKFREGDYWYRVTSTDPREVEVSYPGDTPAAYSFNLSSGYVLPTEGTTSQYAYLTIPSTVTPSGFTAEQTVSYAVTGIGDFAFVNAQAPTDNQTNFCIVDETGALNTNIRRVGRYAFAGMHNYDNVMMPESIESFGAGAFHSSQVYTVLCVRNANGAPGESKVTEIPDSLVYDYNHVKKIQTCQFFTSKVTRIGNYAFNSKILWDVYAPEDFENLEWVGDRNFPDFPSKAFTVRMGGNLRHLGIGGFGGATLELTDSTLVVPATLELSRSSFAQSQGFNKVVIEEGRTMIPNRCFGDNTRSTIKEVVLPSTLVEIDMYAFASNRRLTAIDLPAGLEKIGTNAFSATGIKHVDIPGSVKEVGNSSFYQCGMETFVTNPGTEIIGDKVLYRCSNLKEAVLAPTVRELGATLVTDRDTETFRLWNAITDPENTTNIDKLVNFEYYREPQSIPYVNHFVLMGLGEKYPYTVKELPVRVTYPEEHVLNAWPTTAGLEFVPEFGFDTEGLGIEATEIPTVFAEADIEYVLANLLKWTLKYRKAGETEWNTDTEIVPADAAGVEEISLFQTYTTEPARKFTALITGLENNTDYEYQISHTVGGQEYSDIIRTFRTGTQTGIGDVVSDSRGIYPNPASEYISVPATGGIEVYSLSGALVLTADGSAEGCTHVDVEGLAGGVYVVRYAAGTGIRTERLVIKHK